MSTPGKCDMGYEEALWAACEKEERAYDHVYRYSSRGTQGSSQEFNLHGDDHVWVEMQIQSRVWELLSKA